MDFTNLTVLLVETFELRDVTDQDPLRDVG